MHGTCHAEPVVVGPGCRRLPYLCINGVLWGLNVRHVSARHFGGSRRMSHAECVAPLQIKQ
jgi:hypothetical protein